MMGSPAALCSQLERNLFVSGSLAGERNLEIGMVGRRRGSRFRQTRDADVI
jgi:hypothetical protein